jgi:hypothetical protein
MQTAPIFRDSHIEFGASSIGGDVIDDDLELEV